MLIFLLLCKSGGKRIFRHDVQQGLIAKNITVDLGGQGDFNGVQKAIDSVPSNNNLWTLIRINPGIYNEKVIIPQDKQFIILQGEGRRTTVIQCADYGSATQSDSLILSADNFVAKHIAFNKTYNLDVPNKKPIRWAPAATIYGDKASFYGCGFHGVLDTLTDASDRHLYRDCYIEGAVNFIWGRGQSAFEKCDIDATSYITAQGNFSPEQTSGFVFLHCNVVGTGPVYLGRAYGNYSTVVFKETFMDSIVVPAGWFAWNYVGHEDHLTYTEVLCSGPGSIKSKRVGWEKDLRPQELGKFVVVNNFISQDGWIHLEF